MPEGASLEILAYKHEPMCKTSRSRAVFQWGQITAFLWVDTDLQGGNIWQNIKIKEV